MPCMCAYIVHVFIHGDNKTSHERWHIYTQINTELLDAHCIILGEGGKI